MKALKITGISLAVLAVAILVFIGFFLPDIAKNIAIKQVLENTGRKLAIEKILINPFGMTVEIKSPEMKEADGKTTFVAFSSVRGSLSISSLWKRAIVLDEATIRSPYVRVVRLASNRYNFSDIQERMEELKKKKPQKKKGETKFSINNIRLSGGTVIFDDQVVKPRTVHTVRQMEFYLPFISTIPYLADTYVTPSFSAVVNGSPFKVEGKMKPFEKSVEASVAVKLDNADIPYYHSYFPGDLPVKPDAGKISADLLVAYTAHQDKKPDLDISGTLGLSDVFLRDRTGAPIFALKKGETAIRRAGVMAKDYEIDSLGVDGLEVWLSRDSHGVWSHTRLTSGKKEEKKEEKKGPGVTVRVNLTEARNGKVHFRDDAVPGGFKEDLSGISLDLGGYNTVGENAVYRLSLDGSRGEKLNLSGIFSPEPLSTLSTVTISGLKLEAFYPYLASQLTTPVKGNAAVSAEVAYDKAGGLRVNKGDVELKRLAASFGGGDGAYLGLLAVRRIGFDQKEKRLSVGKVDFDRGKIKVTREKNGKISAMNIIKAQKKGSSVQVKHKGRGESTFKYKVDDLALSRLDLTFRDRSPAKGEATFRLRSLHADMKNLTGPKFSTIPFRVATGYAANGRITASGSILPDPLRLKVKTNLSAIPVADVGPYLPPSANFFVNDGRLFADAHADLAKKGGEMTGSFGGDVSLRSFQMTDPVTKSNLLAWNRLDLDSIDGGLGKPFRLWIKEVVLSDYYVAAKIAPDGNINLTQLVKSEPKKEEPQKQAPPPDIRVDKITMENGVAAFEDKRLQPVYSTQIVKLGGSISGLSSQAGKKAAVDLRGSLENHSPLRISGEVSPLGTPIYANLQVNFDNIELPRLTTYSDEYTGYPINKGKLSANLHYKVEGKQLQGENKVFVDQLFLGKKKEAGKAPVPLPLAVSILKDKNGEIRLDVPVSGRTDNPQFSLWNTIKQTMTNLFVKITTDPFGYLAGIFKGKESFRDIFFDYGKFDLSANEQEKLKGLAKALEERPGLKLDVMGYVDKDRDAEGYRNQELIDKMRYEKFIAGLKKGEPPPQRGQIPDTVRIEPGEYSQYLKEAYRRETFPKPKDSFGRPRDLSDEEMKKLILSYTQVGDTDLQELSRKRSRAVRDFLSAQGVPQGRLFLKMGDVYKEPDRQLPTKAHVEFGPATSK